MKKRGVCVSPNVKPGMLLVHPKLEEMKEKDMFIRASESDEPGIGTWWGGKGMFVDFTKDSTRENWKALLKENVLEYGTSSVWNDNCEYDSLIDKDCRCSFEGKGGTIGQLKSVMSNIMCQIAGEAIHETFENTRPYIVCRSGHCGIQRYAQTWAGDNLTCWDSLKYNIATILGMSLSGVANQGCDIGGFYGPAPEAELLVRWIQNGIFQPRSPSILPIQIIQLQNPGCTATAPIISGRPSVSVIVSSLTSILLWRGLMRQVFLLWSQCAALSRTIRPAMKKEWISCWEILFW